MAFSEVAVKHFHSFLLGFEKYRNRTSEYFNHFLSTNDWFDYSIVGCLKEKYLIKFVSRRKLRSHASNFVVLCLLRNLMHQTLFLFFNNNTCQLKVSETYHFSKLGFEISNWKESGKVGTINVASMILYKMVRAKKDVLLLSGKWWQKTNSSA